MLLHSFIINIIVNIMNIENVGKALIGSYLISTGVCTIAGSVIGIQYQKDQYLVNESNRIINVGVYGLFGATVGFTAPILIPTMAAVKCYKYIYPYE